MSSRDLTCTLCASNNGGRISEKLSDEYARIGLLSGEEREQNINQLFRKLPPCAVARIALAYQDETFASALKKEYGGARALIPSCPLGGAEGHVFPLQRMVDAVSKYIASLKSNNFKSGQNGNHYVADGKEDSADLNGYLEYAHETRQDWLIEAFNKHRTD